MNSVVIYYTLNNTLNSTLYLILDISDTVQCTVFEISSIRYSVYVVYSVHCTLYTTYTLYFILNISELWRIYDTNIT